MKIWEKSEAYFEYLGFILAINDAIKGKSNSRGSENCSDAVLKVVTLLDKLDKKIDETPPIQQPQRFGNIAFRTWYQKLKDDSLVLLQEVLPKNLFQSIPEIVSYFIDGFGNSTRIDYGTGHEISFVMFLCCLFKIGLLKENDKTATGCKIFPRYLDVARKLQQTYRMEPAGSHGVWSLDDFQFIPFIWGSSQLFAHPVIEPARFLDQNILNHFGDDFMFLTCIRYINQVKTGPFAEHSNQLWSISGVPSWSKINGGLIKMYRAEVLSKFPVVQHIVFGSLFTLKAMEQCSGLMTAKTSMIPPPAPFSKETRGSVVERKRDSSDMSMPTLTSDEIGGTSLHSAGKIRGQTPSQSTQSESIQSSVKETLSGASSIQDEKESRKSMQSDQKEPSKTSQSGEFESARTSTGENEPSKTSTQSSEKGSIKGIPTQIGEKTSSKTSVGSDKKPIGTSKETGEEEQVGTSSKQSGETTLSMKSSLKVEEKTSSK
ncbi:PTPA and/or DBP domain containing protein [Asbolus verrucosus]|uniref:Serine/threonine-protein phosphatase 2A activator n=1 Tax=Asbolus verrucosus TaxID=1661398 RepID=A0A482VSW0_ASBVE|nr:PTPA and/or DBP domain containing protein [Asbolus verrucosus]